MILRNINKLKRLNFVYLFVHCFEVVFLRHAYELNSLDSWLHFCSVIITFISVRGVILNCILIRVVKSKEICVYENQIDHSSEEYRKIKSCFKSIQRNTSQNLEEISLKSSSHKLNKIKERKMRFPQEITIWRILVMDDRNGALRSGFSVTPVVDPALLLFNSELTKGEMSCPILIHCLLL